MTVFCCIVLVVNFLCALVYALFRLGRKENPGIAALFLFLPVLGFAIYFLPRQIQRLLGRERYDRDSLVRRFQLDRLASHPDMQEELSVVPVEDAMAVSANAEKRALLLSQLKKDADYRVLLAAENDQDSESVHYVAAAKMEASRVLQQRWAECCEDYEKDPDSPEKGRRACDALRELIESSVLSPREKAMYQRTYGALLLEREARNPEAIRQKEYEAYLFYLADLGEEDEAIRFWETRREQVKSEESYMKMMELFYNAGDNGRFRACLRLLQSDREVRLSSQGLERLRYWMARCEEGGAALVKSR